MCGILLLLNAFNNRREKIKMERKALVVVDMQRDYLCRERKPMFSYDTDKLVNSVNEAIAEYSGMGYDIIYIKQVFQNIITNKWFIGFTLKDTPGAELYDGVNVVSDYSFEKYFPDTFSSKEFRAHVKHQGYSEMVLCGLDECGCVGATAKGAVKAGLKTYMLTDSIGRRFPDVKVKKMREQLGKIGVTYI